MTLGGKSRAPPPCDTAEILSGWFVGCKVKGHTRHWNSYVIYSWNCSAAHVGTKIVCPF